MSINFDFSVFTSQFFDRSVLMYAVLVGIMTSLCASVLGVNLVLKRLSMIGDGLSHVGFLALAIAALAGIGSDRVMYVTVPVVTVAAIFLMWLSDGGKLKGDSATALVSVGTVAVGYVIYSIAESGSGDVCSSLFGAAILTTKSTDTLVCVIMSAAVILCYIFFYNRIFAVTFDETFAKSAGMNTRLLNMLLAVMAAVTIVVGMNLIGSIMISAVIVIPALAAMRLFRTFKSVVISAAFISVGCFVLGFFFAVTCVINKSSVSGGGTVMLPVGATIVCFNVLALVAACIIEKCRIGRKAKTAASEVRV